ncbi:type IV secretion system protein [Sphingomonas oligophenolica]|uniref:Type IV secretion system protein n=1 Tax=Sphingomonas oligophenolica TaxID=301154 RepID=A0ABU9XX24_9SPHN
MNKTSRDSLDAYYGQAESWAHDQQDALRASRKVAWIVAGAAVVVALCEALALIALAPLKTVVPYTLLVDRHTGFVEALKPLDAATIAPDKALTQSFLVQYVIARESFDADALQSNYRKTTLWSADPARTDYVTSVQVSNPGSPLARYPRSTVVDTRVKSVSPLGGNAALVRFETQRHDAGGQAQAPRAWVAVIRYRFSGEPMTREDRFVNPLGFQVVRYHRDAEAIPEPEATSTAAPGTSGPGAGVPAAQAAPGMVPATGPTPAPTFPPPRRATSQPSKPEVEL